MTNQIKQVANTLLESIQSEDVSKHVPRHDRFEVEDTKSRQTYSFVLHRESNEVWLHNTSRGAGNYCMSVITQFGCPPSALGLNATKGHASWPNEFKSAVEYYHHLFRKALRIEDGVAFLGYVDEKFEPIEEDESEEA